MEISESYPFAQLTFSEQSSEDRASCTAHSLINLVRLAGGSVHNDEIGQLRDIISSTGKPLDKKFDEEFITSHGLVAENLYSYFWEIPRTVDGITEAIFTKLQEGPMLVSIATDLSLRDRSSVVNTELGDKPANAHAVVLARDNRSIYLIDPYKPKQAKSFNIEVDTQKLDLLAWFTSGRAREILEQSGQKIDRESILSESKKHLTNPELSQKFISEELFLSVPIHAHKKD